MTPNKEKADPHAEREIDRKRERELTDQLGASPLPDLTSLPVYLSCCCVRGEGRVFLTLLKKWPEVIVLCEVAIEERHIISFKMLSYTRITVNVPW